MTVCANGSANPSEPSTSSVPENPFNQGGTEHLEGDVPPKLKPPRIEVSHEHRNYTKLR
jgi:hypothetical protein